MTNALNPFSTPPDIQPKVRVYDLKSRLDWGEPALTILDARDRQQFNQEHIMGAISMPADELKGQAKAALEMTRDIYIYGETDDETTIAAGLLREAGYSRVAELRGGLAAWKAVGYPSESVAPS
ncbi:MAG: rhodanese-like domain-containing protein [Elainellaceae cyanobacterium]